MGATYSKSVAKSINQTITDITTNVSISSQQSCSATSFTNQNINILNMSNTKIKEITLDSTTQVSSSCLQTSENSTTLSTDLQNQLEAKINQSISQNPTLGLNIADTDLEIINQSITKFATNFQVSNLATCVANVASSQGINIGNLSDSEIGSIKLSISSNVIANCVQKNTSFQDFSNTVSNKLAATAEQSVSQGINFGSIIMIIILLLAGAFIFLKGGVSALTRPPVIITGGAVLVSLAVIRLF